MLDHVGPLDQARRPCRVPLHHADVIAGRKDDRIARRVVEER